MRQKEEELAQLRHPALLKAKQIQCEAENAHLRTELERIIQKHQKKHGFLIK